MAIRFLDEEKPKTSIKFLDETPKLDQTETAWSKAESISAAPSPFEYAVGKTKEQIKNIAGMGFYKPKGLSKSEELAGSLLGGEIIGGAIINKGLKGIQKLYNIPSVKNNAVLKKSVNFFKQAISPRIKGKIVSEATLKASDDKIGEGLELIYKNKSNLNYGDEIGRTPETVDELVTAANQTKQKIFKEYNVSESLGNNVKVDMKDVAYDIFKSQATLSSKIATPKTQQYAFEEAKRLASFGEVPLNVAEDIITKYNAKLKPFYDGRASSLDDVALAHVDAKAANVLRTKVDDVISNLTGKDYQGLKNAYGAVSEIEENAVKQAAKMAKKVKSPMVGTLDTVPILYGAFTGNTPLVTAGIVNKVIKNKLNLLKDPDFLVSKTFKILGKAKEKTAIKKAIDVPLKGAVGSQIIKKKKENKSN